MKLVFTEHDYHQDCVPVSWGPEDRDVSWVSLFLAGMSESRPELRSDETEITTGLFDEFSRACISAEYSVYAILTYPFEAEFQSRVKELQGSGFNFLTERELSARRGLLWRFLRGRVRTGDILAEGVRWQDVSRWYRDDPVSWSSVSWRVLISPRPLKNWVDELVLLRSQGLDKQFLRRTGQVLLNHFEHGMEVIGLEVPIVPLEEAAKSISRKFELPLQINKDRLRNH